MIPPLHRWLPSATILLLALVVGCAQAQQSPPDLDCDNPFAAVGGAPDFDMSHWSTDFCEHSVPYSEIISGGPPPDGIPPIDNPAYTDIASADDWIANDEPVIALDVNGDARAYPLQILTWHEIVNDTIGGTPVAVTFCPLCYAAVTFVRPEIDGERLTFGTTGNLRHSDMVMWDRQTESWWQQFTGEGIVGDLTGETLESIPAPMISWAEFKETHPEGQVLSRDTGFNRRYGENPYVGYDDVNETPFLYRGAVGDQLPPMARVVGIEEGDGRAYAFQDLEEQRVINDTVAGRPVAVFWAPGTASAMDRRQITGSRDVGAVGTFDRRVDGRTLTFQPTGENTFTDEETGSTWTLLGKATDGPLEGAQLDALVHHHIFWFVWSAFQPEGDLYAAAE
jgi:hypothetical protein